jgi:hypothetical protein
MEHVRIGFMAGSMEHYKGLLESLEDVDVRGKRKETLLHLAVVLEKVEWVEALLCKGADPCLRDGRD